MIRKQYVSMKLLSIIVSFALAFGFITTIQQSDSYAEESSHPTTTLNVVGAKEEVTWRIAKTMPLRENYTFADTQTEFKDYVLGTPIERTWENIGEDGVVPYWSIKSSELKKCGIITGISLSKDDNTFIRSYYASDLTVSYEDITSLKRSELESPAKAGAMTVDGVTPVNSEYDSYRFSCLVFHDTQNKMMMNKSVITMRDDNEYAEVYWNDNTTELKEAKDQLNTIFTIYFNGEERELLFDIEDMSIVAGEKSTRIAKTQSSYYGEATVVYESSDDSVATVDATTGEVTGVAEGEATITASIKDGDKETSKSYKVIVTKASDPAVDEVIEKINAIDDLVTLDSEKGIIAAREAYNALEEEQKAMIDTAVLKKLTDAERALKELKATPVKEAIAALPKASELTLNDKAAVEAARVAYDALSSEAKEYVDNITTLELAEATIAKLEAQAELAQAKEKLNEALENAEPEDDIDKLAKQVSQAKEDLEKAGQELKNLKDEIAAKALTVSVLKVTSKAKKFTITWKKNAKSDGYQVQFKLKSAKKYKTLKTLTGTRVVSKKLKKGKKYQFRVRTYRLVNGKTVYGKWSGVKTCVCK